MSIEKHISHNWNVICDICGKKKKRYECILAYGSGTLPVVMSCRDGCADYNHPLNYPPPVIFDGRPVPDARPDQQNNKETFVPVNNPSFMTWGHFFQAGVWSKFNNPNTEFNLNGIWTWGNFKRI
jgi:hypothetical protein